jgi:hypothetical protein
MSERAWNVAAWTTGGMVMLVWGLLWLTVIALSVIIVAVGTYDVLNDWQSSWVKAAILLVLIRVLLTGHRVRKLDEKIDELRMVGAAIMCYLDIEFRNRPPRKTRSPETDCAPEAQPWGTGPKNMRCGAVKYHETVNACYWRLPQAPPSRAHRVDRVDEKVERKLLQNCTVPNF